MCNCVKTYNITITIFKFQIKKVVQKSLSIKVRYLRYIKLNRI